MYAIKNAFYFIVLSLLLASCYKDKGNYSYAAMDDITIAGIEDNYTLTPGVDRLQLDPTVTSIYPESDLEYAWYLYQNDNEISNDKSRDTIGTNRQLDYLPHLNTGRYFIFFYVKNKKNNYFSFKKFTIDIGITGFYLLKETNDGNTDFDLMISQDRFSSDLIREAHGSSLQGAPLSMGILYSLPYVDPETLERSYTSCIGIVTDSKIANVYRAADLYLVHDHSTLFYGETQDVPAKFYTLGWTNGYFSNLGNYTVYNFTPSTGRLGNPSDYVAGGSDQYAVSFNLNGLLYWNTDLKAFCYSNYNGLTATVTAAAGLSNLNLDITVKKMLAVGGNVYAIVKDNATGKDQLYYFSCPVLGSAKLSSVTDIPADSKLLQATTFGVNEITSEYLYFAIDNTPYYYDLTSNTESPLTFNGLPADETITYLTNRFNSIGNLTFDYLMVATYKGGNYKLYMYEMLGGKPIGSPVMTATGSGKIKEVHYLSNGFEPFSDLGSGAAGYSR